MAGKMDAIDRAIANASDKEGKYLTFSLADEEYGIGILTVKEIIGMMPVTTVPRTPHFIKGVINLRGKVIPVIDLRLKFDMPEEDYTERTCIIVVEVQGLNEQIQMGMVVDSVTEVLNISAVDIEEAPAFGAAVDTNYIMGMAKQEGSVKILLDINRVLNSQELEGIESIA